MVAAVSVFSAIRQDADLPLGWIQWNDIVFVPKEHVTCTAFEPEIAVQTPDSDRLKSIDLSSGTSTAICT
jgi:hypothetical protein